MKVTLYIRLAKNKTKILQSATPKPSDAPLYTEHRERRLPLPTIAFALDIDLPDDAFNQAERVLAEIAIADGTLSFPATVSYNYQQGENNDDQARND